MLLSCIEPKSLENNEGPVKVVIETGSAHSVQATSFNGFNLNAETKVFIVC